MDISPDGQTLALAGNQLTYLDAATGSTTATFPMALEYGTVDYAPNGQFLIVSVLESNPRIFMKAPGTNTTLRSYSPYYTHGVYDVEISPNGRGFVIGGGDTVTFWQTTVDRPLFIHGETAFCVDFSGDGNFVATGHKGGKIIVWHYPTLTQVRVLQTNPEAFVANVEFDDVSGKLVAVLQYGHPSADNMYAWNSSSFELSYTKNIGSAAFSILAPPSGDLVYVSSLGGGVQGRNRFTGDLQEQVSLDVGLPEHIKFAQGGSKLVSASRDVNGYRAVDAFTGAGIWSMRADGSVDAALGVSFDGSRVGLADMLGVRIADVASGNILHTVRHKNRLSNIALSPNPDVIAFAEGWPASSPRIFVWSLTSGRLAALNTGGYNYGLEFTSDGQFLICSVSQGIIQVYRTDTWQLVRSHEFNGHISDGPEFTVSSDGALLAVSSGDHPFYGVRIVRLSDFSEVVSFAASPPWDLEFSADGQTLWVARHAIHAYRVSDGQLFYSSNYPEVGNVGRIAVSPSTGDVAFYRGDGTHGLLRNPLR